MSLRSYVMFAQVTDMTTFVARSLEVRAFDISADMDRSPFGAFTLTLAPVDATTWDWLDPRDSNITLGWNVHAYDDYGVEVGRLPFGRFLGRAKIRRRSRDLITGEVTIQATTLESLLDDKRRIAGTTVNTGATTLEALILWALVDLQVSYPYINAAIIDSTGTGAVAIPAGDRRLWLQGETLFDLFEAELSSTGRRFYDSLEGGLWKVLADDDAPLDLSQPTTLMLTDGDTGTIISASEDTDRASWADGVLVKFQYVNSGGTNVIAYQASGTGANTRGEVINQSRPAPSSNYANRIVTRTQIRGTTYEITADADTDAHPGQDLTATIAGVAHTGQVRAVDWRFPEGVMTVKAQVQ